MKITRTQLTKIMLNAWKIARYGASHFGGNTKQYFSLALKFAWREARQCPATSWSKDGGTRYSLPGIEFTAVVNGQILLPGMMLK